MEGHAFDQLPAYALGCLDDDELIAVGKHLDACAQCRAELRTYLDVTDQLGFAAPLVEPPPNLRDKVLASVIPERRGQTERPAEHKERSWATWLRSLSLPWAAATLLVILALAASNIFLWSEVNRLKGSAGETGFRAVAMVSPNPDSTANGVLVISHDGRYGTLVVDDLPELDEDHEYQLWLIRDGERTSGGTFSVGRGGYASLWVSSREPLASFPSYGITIEPKGGSPGPTGEKVLGGEL